MREGSRRSMGVVVFVFVFVFVVFALVFVFVHEVVADCEKPRDEGML